MPPLPAGIPELTRDPRQARALQEQLAGMVSLEDRVGDVRLIAGVDVSAGRSGVARAAVVVLRYPELDVVEQAVFARSIDFPYVPGLLSFRELPAILGAWQQIVRFPGLVVVDGQGIAHPRRLGIASHLGLVVGRPTIGCAKSRLTGQFEPPGDDVGSVSALLVGRERIGSVIKTRKGSRPLFISPGHLVSVESATAWIWSLCRGYRLPEPTRRAHNSAGEAARAAEH